MKATVWANVLEERQEKSRDDAMSVKETDTVGKKRARKGQEKIVSIIEADPYVSIAAIACESGFSVKTVRNLIEEMRKDNLIVRIGPDKGGYWQLLK
ncbi:MAG: winged helix-turn-helix transcriptional regulator [Rikenellaceae bacterium]|nr:winged helix-turn-helix transcriptional regulator [Rikenellaceae bacterium]